MRAKNASLPNDLCPSDLTILQKHFQNGSHMSIYRVYMLSILSMVAPGTKLDPHYGETASSAPFKSWRIGHAEYQQNLAKSPTCWSERECK